jgi:hypothetical protein
MYTGSVGVFEKETAGVVSPAAAFMLISPSAVAVAVVVEAVGAGEEAGTPRLGVVLPLASTFLQRTEFKNPRGAKGRVCNLAYVTR